MGYILYTKASKQEQLQQSGKWKHCCQAFIIFSLREDVPARREDFFKITDSTNLPLKYVSHWWLESEPVYQIEKALKTWKDILKNLKAARSKKSGNKSYETVVKAIKDKLMRAKLQFCDCIGGEDKLFIPCSSVSTFSIYLLSSFLSRLEIA